MAEPVRVTVLWHRECAEGKDLAAAVSRWFRGNPDDPGEVGCGLQVHYCCRPEGPVISSLHHLAFTSPSHSWTNTWWWTRHGRACLTDLTNEIDRAGGLLVLVALDASSYQPPFAVISAPVPDPGSGPLGLGTAFAGAARTPDLAAYLGRRQTRILLGGEPSGYSSFMPGLFEEFLISRTPLNNRLPVPVFVIGAFGGAAGQLTAALTRRTPSHWRSN